MDENIIIPGESLADIITNQLNMMLAFLDRPVVQQQILAIAGIIIIAMLLPEGVRRWWQRRQSDDVPETDPPHQQPWTDRLYGLYAPLTGLVLANVVIWLFERQGHPNGLVESSRTFFWLWLAYRALLMVLYARLGDSVKPYHNFVFIPIFVLVLLWLFLGRQVGTALVANVPILTLGSFTLTLGNLINATVLLYIFLIGAWVVERALNRALQNRFDAEPGKIRSLATLVRYSISALGIVISLAALGLDATSLGLVAGGLSVGIGIGMQDIVGNFVSGLTLLFEQSLRPGDVIELNGRLSEVERVSLRTTTVTTLDNIKMIIPNSTFTTQPVTTLTKDNNLIRVLIPLRVAYDSNPDQVKRIVEQTATQHAQVLRNPKPLLLSRGLGTDSSYDFDLSVWTNRPKARGLLQSELYYLLFAALAEQGIKIHIPTRELKIIQNQTNPPAEAQT
ncbi:MAG: mechanosensitive ion channel [Anaerolineae bacterium]|nr:mechanosensitive ion channel [Anaerolineae bacterium]